MRCAPSLPGGQCPVATAGMDRAKPFRKEDGAARIVSSVRKRDRHADFAEGGRILFKPPGGVSPQNTASLAGPLRGEKTIQMVDEAK